MTCNKQSGPIVGGVYEDPTIKNPTIIGGIATGITLVGPDINGGISMDDATASILAKILAPYLPELVSSLFKNCEGNALPPGTQLMSCAEILKEIELAICRGCGDGGGGGTDIGDRITNFTFDSATRVLTINVRYADNTTKAWAVTLPAGTGAAGDIIQNFTFNSTTGILTIDVTQADSSSKAWTVDISSLAPTPGGSGDEITATSYDVATGNLVISVEYPDATTKDWVTNIKLLTVSEVVPHFYAVSELPLTVVTNQEEIGPPWHTPYLLGAPIQWGEINIDGNNYLIPLYVKPTDPG